MTNERERSVQPCHVTAGSGQVNVKLNLTINNTSEKKVTISSLKCYMVHLSCPITIIIIIIIILLLLSLLLLLYSIILW